ncbi:signal peptidase I [Halosaccharopolyspora lacisalsi]|nr:signal peptidase I [Halosaccharopolyspora lacisalsi]
MADVMRSPGPEEEPQDNSGAEHGADEQRSGDHSDQQASGHGRKKRQKKKGSFWRELPILVVTALVLTVLIQAFVARVYVIPSESMEDTLHGCENCTNDRILVDKITYRFTDPAPGDVVVFRGPDTWMPNELGSTEPSNPVSGFFRQVGSLLGFSAPNEKDFVKRVIATEGQTVACCDAQNRVTVNGDPLHESYIHWGGGKPHTQMDFGPVTVPENHLWMMGDNRNNSADSRVQGGGGVRGAVPLDDVIGKAQFRVLPPTRWGGITEANPQTTALGATGSMPGLPAGVGFALVWPVMRVNRRLFDAADVRRVREYY